MRSSCFIVNTCEIYQVGDENNLIHSVPNNLVNVETLPYVNDLNLVICVEDSDIIDVLTLELQIFNDKGELIAYSPRKDFFPAKATMKTYCKVQTVHCSEGKHKIVLFCNSEATFEYEYWVNNEEILN